MKNWRAIASASGLGIPEADMDRVVPVLEALDATFQPLIRTIPHDLEPAIIFHLNSEEGE